MEKSLTFPFLNSLITLYVQGYYFILCSSVFCFFLTFLDVGWIFGTTLANI